jgi:hypothetical protein
MVIDEVLTPTDSTITFWEVVTFTANGRLTNGQLRDLASPRGDAPGCGRHDRKFCLRFATQSAQILK